jgi:hypothetical protein
VLLVPHHCSRGERHGLEFASVCYKMVLDPPDRGDERYFRVCLSRFFRWLFILSENTPTQCKGWRQTLRGGGCICLSATGVHRVVSRTNNWEKNESMTRKKSFFPGHGSIFRSRIFFSFIQSLSNPFVAREWQEKED